MAQKKSQDYSTIPLPIFLVGTMNVDRHFLSFIVNQITHFMHQLPKMVNICEIDFVLEYSSTYQLI